MMLNNYQYQSELLRSLQAQGRQEGRAEGRQEGRAEGRQEALADAALEVLRARGLEVSDELESRIRAIQDPDRIAGLHRRAVTVAAAADLFR